MWCACACGRLYLSSAGLRELQVVGAEAVLHDGRHGEGVVGRQVATAELRDAHAESETQDFPGLAHITPRIAASAPHMLSRKCMAMCLICNEATVVRMHVLQQF